MPYISKNFLDNQLAIVNDKINNDQSFLQDGLGAVVRTIDSKLKDFVSVKDFGAVGDGITDDSVAIQLAVNYCISFKEPISLSISGIHNIVTPIKINRPVDGVNSMNIFRIQGVCGNSGFKTSLGISLFTSNISNIDEVQTQCISFYNLTFTSENISLPSYVLDGSKFIRTTFNCCSYNGIKLLTTTNYIQSIKLYACDVRGWDVATFMNTTGGAYDIKLDNITAEHGGSNFLNLTSSDGSKGVAGCSVTNTLIEGIAGDAITADNALGLAITACYFEANSGVDIKLDTPANLNGPCKNLGVFLAGNYHSQSQANKINSNYYSIRYGNSTGATIGCFSDGNLDLSIPTSLVTTIGNFQIN
jgi:hypothetical protein